jgi:hypothetical protein
MTSVAPALLPRLVVAVPLRWSLVLATSAVAAGLVSLLLLLLLLLLRLLLLLLLLLRVVMLLLRVLQSLQQPRCRLLPPRTCLPVRSARPGTGGAHWQRTTRRHCARAPPARPRA